MGRLIEISLIKLTRPVDECQERGNGMQLLLPPESHLSSFLTMINLLTNPPLGELPSGIQSCRHQHQTWATTLAGDEQEIDQLLTLLAELPSNSYRSLQPYTVDYAQVLNRLKVRMNRLRVDAVCTGTGCSSSTPPAACPDPRFVSPMTGNTLIASVSAEFSRAKERCDAFFCELMVLNLI